MTLTRTASGAARVAHGALEARTRRDLLRLTRTVVAVKAPHWRSGGTETVVVKDPKLTADDVRVAFEQICEKLRVDGVALEVRKQEPAALWAVFRKFSRTLSGRCDSRCDLMRAAYACSVASGGRRVRF